MCGGAQAIQINQAWAGHPGHQALHGIGNNSAVEVWIKPLGKGRTAAFVINTQDKVANAKTAVPTSAIGAVGERRAELASPMLQLVACDADSPSQQWNISGVDISVLAEISNHGKDGAGDRGCWEIHGCSTKVAARIDSTSGCKPMPKTPVPPGSGNQLCAWNAAWSLHRANGSIQSNMDGKCLDIDWGHGAGLTVSECNTHWSQKWQWGASASGGVTSIKLADNRTDPSTHGSCIDNGQLPSPPPPGPHPGPHKKPAGDNATVTFKLSDLGLSGDLKIRDVWSRKDLGVVKDGEVSLSIAHHGSQFLVFLPADDTAWPLPFELAPWMDKPAPPTPP